MYSNTGMSWMSYAVPSKSSNYFPCQILFVRSVLVQSRQSWLDVQSRPQVLQLARKTLLCLHRHHGLRPAQEHCVRASRAPDGDADGGTGSRCYAGVIVTVTRFTLVL